MVMPSLETETTHYRLQHLVKTAGTEEHRMLAESLAFACIARCMYLLGHDIEASIYKLHLH
jgi:hypothetical protein